MIQISEFPQKYLVHSILNRGQKAGKKFFNLPEYCHVAIKKSGLCQRIVCLHDSLLLRPLVLKSSFTKVSCESLEFEMCSIKYLATIVA